MGTARSTSTTTPAPRKRAPRKAAPKPAVVDEPAVTPIAEPPAVATANLVEKRIASLRSMIADIDASTVTPSETVPGEDRIIGPVTVPGEDRIVGPVKYSRDFEPIPGVDLDMLHTLINDEKNNPDKVQAENVISGLRMMIVENGHDPDVVIDAAFHGVRAIETIGKPTVNANGLFNAVIEFRGRQIEVTTPEIEQVMVIRRMQSLFANAAKMESIEADEAIRLMDRALKAVCSVIVNPDDVEFLEDLFLTRQAKIEDMLPILSESMQALERANANNGNRADRRKAAKSSGQAGRAALVTTGE